MALRVWLPLNGDVVNKGCSDLAFSVVSSNMAANTSGKIGSCYANDSLTAGGLVSDKTILLGTSQSMFCWFKFTTLNSGSSLGAGLVSQHRFSSNQGMGITIRYASATTGYLSVNTGDGTNRTYNTYYGTTLLQANTWYHGGYTYDGSNIRIYVNGVLEKTQAFTGMSVPADYITVFCWSTSGTSGNGVYGNYKLNGSLNDVRIYDHCLSTAEVRELARGLVCHYKLDSPYETGAASINKYSRPYSDGYPGYSSFTVTKLTGERGYNYKLDYTGTGSNYWPYCIWPSYSFTAGKTYFYSVKVRCNKWSTGELRLRASRVANDWGTNNILVCSPSLADGKWHEYYVSQVVNETFTRSGSTLTCVPVLEFYTSNFSVEGTAYQCDFDLKDIQVVESDVYLPFVENDYLTATVTDSSGYGHHGTAVNVPTINTDSPRNSCSMTFDGNSQQYIRCGRGGMVRDEITVSLWVYSDDWSTAVIRWVSCTESGGWCFQYSASGIQFVAGTGESSNTYKVVTGSVTAASLSAGWHFFAGTYDGLALKIYVDGALAGTLNAYTTKTPLYYHASNGIFIAAEAGGTQTTAASGYYYTGSISDVRIYSTALSAADIAALYNSPVKIDKLGGMHAQTFTEAEGNAMAWAALEVGTASSISYDKAADTYTIVSPVGTSTWGYGPRLAASQQLIVPYGRTWRWSCDVWTPTATTLVVDYDNYAVSGSSWSGNDNDLTTARLSNTIAIPASTWTRVVFGSQNAHTSNTGKVAIYDVSKPGLKTDGMSEALTWKIRNLRWYLVDDSANPQVKKNGTVRGNFLTEGSRGKASFGKKSRDIEATKLTEM